MMRRNRVGVRALRRRDEAAPRARGQAVRLHQPRDAMPTDREGPPAILVSVS